MRQHDTTEGEYEELKHRQGLERIECNVNLSWQSGHLTGCKTTA